MEYLHKLNVAHRDLKPGNIVLDDFMRAKIVDFGLAVMHTSTMTSFRGNSEAGTPAFMVSSKSQHANTCRLPNVSEYSQFTPQRQMHMHSLS